MGVHFAHANSTFEDAHFVIVGVPYDRNSAFRPGTRAGPIAIRKASQNFDPYLLRHNLDLATVPIHDMGNVTTGSPEKMEQNVKAAAQKIVDAGKFPIFLGGAHGITVPIVSTYSNIGLLSIDAHLNFKDEDEGDRLAHGCVLRRTAELLGKENVLAFGVRSVTKDDISEGTPNYIDAFQIQDQGIDSTWKMAMNMIRKDKVYLSLDMDGLDPAFAPATGSPEPFGLTSYQVAKCINMLGDRIVGFDVSEVAPSYDHGNTAALAARMVYEIVAVVWTQHLRKMK